VRRIAIDAQNLIRELFHLPAEGKRRRIEIVQPCFNQMPSL
jgi:hypothetical protein